MTLSLEDISIERQYIQERPHFIVRKLYIITQQIYYDLHLQQSPIYKDTIRNLYQKLLRSIIISVVVYRSLIYAFGLIFPGWYHPENIE